MINTTIKNILVPLDFSETSLNALETAIVVAAEIDTGFKQFSIGAFEQQIINHASIPVLSIRPKFSRPD